MKAVILEAFGGPEMLKTHEVAMPKSRPGDVLVRVEAAGVCHHDVMHRAGKLPGAKIGVVLGHETAGEIVAVGENVTTRKVGERVVLYQRRFCGACRNCLRGRHDMCHSIGLPGVDTEGGYAEFVSVAAEMAIPVPDNVDWLAAALSSCPIGTSVRALKSVAGMNPGDTVLINGASGGLGIHQIQLVRAFGGRSIAVTSSPAKAEHLKAMGADEVVVAPNLDYSAAVWRLTGKQGVDIAMENVGPTLPETLRAMATGGTVVVLGNMAATAVSIAPGLLIGRRLRVVGSGSGTFEDIRQSLALLSAGQVKPVIAEVLKFSEAAKAHDLLDRKAVEGRVLMQGW